MCPDQEMNQQSQGAQDNFQPTEPHPPGLGSFCIFVHNRPTREMLLLKGCRRGRVERPGWAGAGAHAILAALVSSVLVTVLALAV